MQEIKIITKDVLNDKRNPEKFEVWIDGEKIKNLKRFAIDIINPNPDDKSISVYDNSFIIEKFLRVCDNSFYP